MLGREIQVRRSGEFVPSARPPECGCSEADVDIDLVDAGLRPAVTAAAMPRAVADDRLANLAQEKAAPFACGRQPLRALAGELEYKRLLSPFAVSERV